jgi:predicted unusual protein kinase regulating ubiquinone biosynthesis (AarF/ABC1/UbiB family)
VQVREPRLSGFTHVGRFFRVSRLLLWTIWVVYHERRRVIRARERGEMDVQPNVEVLIRVLTAFRQTALRLGVLMIKLGQFLSSRADLLPDRALAVLSSLQDEVPAAPFSHVAAVIQAELGQPVEQLFASFDTEATAAASLGQVHRAVLASSGQQVAVKVQRPNIQRLVDMDLRTLRFVIWIVNRFMGPSDFIDLMGFYREFSRTVHEEIDYVREAANATRFRKMFKDRPALFIPRVCDEYVSRRVLVLEWVDGIKINDYPALDAAGIDRTAAAGRLVEAYLYQFFEVGFFHADPHPGNIFVVEAAGVQGPVIALVDFGMVGSLTKSAKQGLKDLFLGFVVNNPRGMAGALQRLGFIGAGANMAAIERAIGLMLDEYQGLTLGQARDLNLSEVAHEVEGLLYSQPFRIPTEFAFSGKAIGTLSGVATGLAPQLNLLDVSLPYAQRFLGLSREGVEETVEQAIRQLLASGRSLLAIPATLENVLSKFETGQIEVRLADSSRNTRSRRRGWRRGSADAQADGSRVATSFVFAGSLAAGVGLSLAHLTAAGWFCLGLAALTALSSVLRG